MFHLKKSRRFFLELCLRQDGGETRFYKPMAETDGELELLCAVAPVAGAALLFPQAHISPERQRVFARRRRKLVWGRAR